MTFLWAAPGGAGTPPPASVERSAPAPVAVAPALNVAATEVGLEILFEIYGLIG